MVEKNFIFEIRLGYINRRSRAKPANQFAVFLIHSWDQDNMVASHKLKLCTALFALVLPFKLSHGKCEN